MPKTFTYNFTEVTVFRSEINKWCLRIGANVYFGFLTKKSAIEGLANII